MMSRKEQLKVCEQMLTEFHIISEAKDILQTSKIWINKHGGGRQRYEGIKLLRRIRLRLNDRIQNLGVEFGVK